MEFWGTHGVVPKVLVETRPLGIHLLKKGSQPKTLDPTLRGNLPLGEASRQ